MQTIPIKMAANIGSNTLSKEQRAQLLKIANILTADGSYDKRFFSSETIKKDEARRQRQ